MALGFSCLLTAELFARDLTDLGMGATTLLLRGTNEGAAIISVNGKGEESGVRSWKDISILSVSKLLCSRSIH